MKRDAFKIGDKFRCGEGLWRVTDIGTRTVLAIRIDRVCVTTGTIKSSRIQLTGEQAEAEGWFNGPPYAVRETVFDENDMPACSPVPADVRT